MTFKYYLDTKLVSDLFRYRMRPYLAPLADTLREIVMPPIDIKKLADNMARANKLIATAASENERGAAILDNFEKHLTNTGLTLDSIKEYSEQLASMQAVTGNAGPALNDSFHGSTANSSLDLATGDPKR